MALPIQDRTEWLETNGLGGFAMGTADLVRTRRYHALLVAALQPPSGRVVLVGGFDAWIETGAGRTALTSQRYESGAIAPDGLERIEHFQAVPWPRWTFAVDAKTRVEHELLMAHGTDAVLLTWRLLEGSKPAALVVRPFLSGRDYHALHRENAVLSLASHVSPGRVEWRTYASLPPVVARSNGQWTDDPHWYRGFRYDEELARGHDGLEDLPSPGTLRFDLHAGPARLLLCTAGSEALLAHAVETVHAPAERIESSERERRAAFETPLARAADAYLVRRGRGLTVIAGYPWFTDWGRDTFIALRGLCFATGRFDAARAILVEWSRTVSEGMLPNRFPDGGAAPEYNAVDASLWYVVTVGELIDAARRGAAHLPTHAEKELRAAVLAIVSGYAGGTRFGIRADTDGLLAAGERGMQLTWMDAKIGDWVVTPRIGKPVEIQALWIHALAVASRFEHRWSELLAHARESFAARFWNGSRKALFDVVDVDHRAGDDDPTLRPNQLLAVGGLPDPVLTGERARAVVDTCERELWTPLGPRSLAPGEPGYRGRYQGGPLERDGAYHMGTVWPWLAGAFVEAWVRVRGDTAEVRQRARDQFLEPLLARALGPGAGHLPEIADGDEPHAPRGAPFQAWSLGELLRLDRSVLAASESSRAVS